MFEERTRYGDVLIVGAFELQAPSLVLPLLHVRGARGGAVSLGVSIRFNEQSGAQLLVANSKPGGDRR